VARQKLGLTQEGLADALMLTGPYGKDTVRSWESGRRPISGPAQVAISLMVKLRELVP
jgi:DNA-binding transcriptional regulator YiaG